MKLLTATNDTQGQRENDFNFCNEGELLHFPLECDHDEDADGPCGCKRSMAGLETNRATTTMKVTDVDLSREEAVLRIAKHYVSNWKAPYDEARIAATLVIDQINDVAELFPVGTVLEKRGPDFIVRVLGRA